MDKSISPWILLGALALPGVLAAETPPPPAFTGAVEVQVVNLEVYATDSEGRPVTDLSGADFKVFEDGKPVELSNFSRIEEGTPVSTAPSPAGEARKATAAGVETSPGLRLVIFVDQDRLGVQGRRNALTQLATVLQERLRPEDQVMVASYDGTTRVVLPFTADRKKLWETLAQATAQVSARQLLARSEREDVFQQLQYDAKEGPCLFSEELYSPYAEKAHSEVLQMIRSLEVFVDSLTGIPGRKAVLHLSDGIPLRPGAEAIEYAIELCDGQGARQGQANSLDTLQLDERSRLNRGFDPQKARLDVQRYDTTDQLQDLSVRANALGVTLYMLQASRAVDTGASATEQLRFQTTLTSWSERGNFQDPLFFLAKDTGGRAFLQGGDFEPGLRAMVEDLRSYYLLGYVPPAGSSGVRHVRVEVSRPGVEVRHRTKYQVRTPQEQIAGRLRSRLLHGVGDNPLGARLELIRQEPGEDGRVKARVLVRMPLNRLALIPGETLKEGLLTFFVTAQDPNGGAAPVRQSSVPLRVPAQGTAGPQGEFTYEIEIAMRKGQNDLGVAVRDELGGETSYLSQRLQLNGNRRGAN